MGLKPDLQGGTGVNLLRVTFRPPQGSKKEVRKWTSLKSKAVPLEGPVLVLMVANLLKRLFQVEADLSSNSSERKLELARSIFARLHFLTF